MDGDVEEEVSCLEAIFDHNNEFLKLDSSSFKVIKLNYYNYILLIINLD